MRITQESIIVESDKERRIDDVHAIVLLDSQYELHICIQPYDANRLGNYYGRDIGVLGRLIDQIIGVDTIQEFARGVCGGDSKYWNIGENRWYRYEWSCNLQPTTKVHAWLYRLGENSMCLAIICFPTNEMEDMDRKIRETIAGFTIVTSNNI
jgi:hypothetical protein